MSNDVYASLSGAAASWQQLETVANNIANSATTGFKAHRLNFENVLVDEGLLGDGHVRIGGSVQDFSDGPLQPDDVSSHFAIRGRGFFEVEGYGGTVLRRAGDFALNEEGFLVTPEGDRVLGEQGAIQLEPGQRIAVASDGSIRADGEIIDKLRIVDAQELRPLGASQWRAESEIFASDATVVQGALEGSNADPIQGMTDLIQTSRYFEMYQKAMQTSDEMDRKNIETANRA